MTWLTALARRPSHSTFRLAGEQYDLKALAQPDFGLTGTNGLYYLRARYYDPAIGRFLTRDPLPGSTLAPQSLNAYPYVQNNPVNRVDPTGMFSELHYISWECLNFALSALVLALSLGNPLIGVFAAPLLLSFAMVLAASTHDVGAVPANAAVGAQSYSAFALTNIAWLEGFGFWTGFAGVMYNMASCIWGGSVIPPEPLR